MYIYILWTDKESLGKQQTNDGNSQQTNKMAV